MYGIAQVIPHWSQKYGLFDWYAKKLYAIWKTLSF